MIDAARIREWLAFYRKHLADEAWVRHFPATAAQYRRLVSYWQSELERRGA